MGLRCSPGVTGYGYGPQGRLLLGSVTGYGYGPSVVTASARRRPTPSEQPAQRDTTLPAPPRWPGRAARARPRRPRRGGGVAQR